MNNINNNPCTILQAVLADMPLLCGGMEKSPSGKALSLSAVAAAGALLNYGEEQIALLHADLHCLYTHSLPRFPDTQEISEKLNAAARLHRQIPEQNGILWQHLCERAAKHGFYDKDQLTDCLVSWLLTTSRSLSLSASVHHAVICP